MNILNTGILVAGVTIAQGSTQKEIGKLVIYSSVPLESLSTETINIVIEKSVGENINITKRPILLKPFILCSTYGDDAVGSFHKAHYEAFSTVAIIDLTEFGNVEIASNDNLVVSLSGLVVGKNYVVDGIALEDSNPLQQDIFEYEEKRVAQELTDHVISLDNYDTCVIQDLESITELNLTHKNKHVSKLSMRELRALSLNKDSIQYVGQDGKTYCSDKDFLAFDSSDLVSMNIIKDGTQQVIILFRHDNKIKQMVKIQNEVMANSSKLASGFIKR